MPRYCIAFALMALLSLVGCVTPSADSRLLGTYFGKGSESLTVLPNTRVYHSRVLDGREQRVLVGYAAAASSSPPGSFSIIAPDTSPFIGTSLQVSDDFRTITVRWQNYRDPKDTSRQTQFVRRSDGLDVRSLHTP
jgi:hypothetical protein